MSLAPPGIRVSHPRPHPRPNPHLCVGEEHDGDDLVDDQVVDLLAQVRDPFLVQPALTPHLCAKQGSEPSVTCTRCRTTARCLSRGVCLCPRQITLQATGASISLARPAAWAEPACLPGFQHGSPTHSSCVTSGTLYAIMRTARLLARACRDTPAPAGAPTKLELAIAAAPATTSAWRSPRDLMASTRPAT